MKMTKPSKIERITRSLAYMLRHQPDQFDLDVDRHGFADLDDVVRALNERLGEPVEEEDVREAVESGDRQRYEIKNDRIRALYGHSIPVEAGEPSKPPELLYVGLSGRDADRAARSGLRGGRRRFLHLALTEEEARETGRRTDEEYAIVTVRALDAWEEGVNFFDRKSLFLAESIPTRFIDVSELFTDGIGPEQRPGSGRRSGGERRGGERRPPRGRDRGQDRDRDRDRGRGRGHGGRERGQDERRHEGDARRRPGRFERGGRSEGDGRRRHEGRREERRGREGEPRRRTETRDDRGGRPADEKQPSADFGTGIFDVPAPPKREPRPKKPSPPPPPPKKTPEAPVVERREEEQGSSFGAGLD